MLVRHLLHQRLAAYYAQSADAVVGSVHAKSSSSSSSSSSSLHLSRLWGEWHWKRLFARLYKDNKGQWLTPVELFQPYYSNTIANFIAASLVLPDDDNDTHNNNNNRHRQHQHQSSAMHNIVIPEFDIIELGGGRGTNAWHILNHLQQHHSHVYEQLQTYYMIDASPSLHELQRETLLRQSSSTSSHALRIRLEQKNLVDVAEGRISLLSSPSHHHHHQDTCLSSESMRHRPTIVVACEVLDNLPHDKIRVMTIGSGGGRTRIQQAEVIRATSSRSRNDDNDHADSSWQEVFRPLQDALIQRVVDSYQRPNSSVLSSRPTTTTPSSTVVQWIPTVACGVLEQLQKERPNFGLVLADFDWLPPPDLHHHLGNHASHHRHGRRLSVPAQFGEPLVTSMQDVDYPCYMSAPAHDDLCDILFPTDFHFLAKFINEQQQQQHPQKNSSSSSSIKVQKQADFLTLYGPEQVDQTRSWLTGYSPLVDDFANCSVLTKRPCILPNEKQSPQY